MAQNRSGDSDANTATAGSAAKPRSSVFKYYIHDGVDACRLQLIGELADADVPELTGCWKTARTILGNRKLVLDLRELSKTDEAGREWLLAMVREGASSLPESYFRDHLAKPTDETTGPKPIAGKLAKLSNILRGEREIDVSSGSSTRVR